MKTVFVTGAGGFIGKVVVEGLLSCGYTVIAMVRPQAVTSLQPDDRLTLLRADITDFESYANKLQSVNVVVHLAANKYDPKLAPIVNLSGAENIARLFTEKKLKGNRLINISSQSTKIKYKGVYGKTKDQSDHILQKETIDWITLKPSLVLGNEIGSLFTSIVYFTRTLPFVPVIGNGKWQVYPIAVEDVTAAIIAAIESDTTIHRIYDLGSKRMVTFDNFIREIQNAIGIKRRIVHIPMWLGLSLTWLMARVVPNLPISTDNILGSNQHTNCNPLPAIKDLKLKPLSLSQAVDKYLGIKEPRPRIAVVGLGKMGILHATVLSAIDNSLVCALVDRDVSLAKTAQSMGINAKVYTSLDVALAEVAIDGVYICTPNFSHIEIMQTCIAHNLPFFVEKPVVIHPDDLVKIIKSSPKQLRAKSASGYLWPYRREVQYVKQLLDKNAIGEVINYSITLKHSEVFGPKKGWLFNRKLSGGGVLMNPGPHAVSVVHYLFGTPVVDDAKVTYLYGNDVEDVAEIQLAHAKGIKGTLLASWSVVGYPIATIEFSITGSLGSIAYEDNLLTIRQKGKPVRKLTYPLIPAKSDIFDLNPKVSGECFYQEDRAFIQSLVLPKPMVNDLSFALAIEKTIQRCYEKSS